MCFISFKWVQIEGYPSKVRLPYQVIHNFQQKDRKIFGLGLDLGKILPTGHPQGVHVCGQKVGARMRPIVHRTLQKKMCCVSVNDPSSPSSSSLKLVPIRQYFQSQQFQQDWTFGNFQIRSISKSMSACFSKFYVPPIISSCIKSREACNHIGCLV